jgi:predicted DNA binding protein
MREESLKVEVRIEGDDCPLAEATRACDVAIEAYPPLLRRDGNALLRFSSPAHDPLSAFLDADDRIRFLFRAADDGRYHFRCLSRHPCTVHDLIDVGFIVDSMTYQDGTAVVTGGVVGHDVLRGVMETAGDTVGVQLKRVYGLPTDEEEGIARQWDITPAQEASLRRAVEMGYFTVPRTVQAAEVAESMNISKSAFLERLHRGLNGLLAQVFDVTPPAPETD